jgi:hypothetical protein
MKRKNNTRNNGNKRRKLSRNAYKLGVSSPYTNYENTRYSFLDPHKYMTLKYTDVVTTSLATTVGVSQVYNLNSLFDPDRTGTGHQPYGFDQMSALYNRYRVLKTRWRICFSPSSLTYAISVIPMNGLLAASVTNLATFVTAAESPRAVNWEQGASGQSHLISGQVPLNNLTGVTSTEYLADDRFEAIVTASPSEVMVLQVVLYNPSGSTISINYVVDLYYEVDMHDPIIQAGST